MVSVFYSFVPKKKGNVIMYDFRKSGDDLLREAIGGSITLPRPPDGTNMIFGQPSTLLDDPRGDATVQLRGVERTYYGIDNARVYYHKIDLDTLFQGNFNPRFVALGQSTLYRLLPQINQALGLQLTEDDVDDIDLRILGEGEEVGLDLRAKPNSRAFKGVTRIIFDRRYILLSDVVTVDTLDLFHHPDPMVEGSQSAGLLTWGLDFTPLYRELEVSTRSNYYRGQFRYYTVLRNELSRLYGIDNWPANNPGWGGEGYIRRYDTRRIENANKDFQYVVMQTMIQTNGYVGTAYFHYNQPT